MSGTITLTGSVKFHASNVSMSKVQRAVAGRIPDASARLKRWLLDVSGRCAPFADFDVRGLPEQDRFTLLEAIRRAAEEAVRGESELAESLRVLCSRIHDAKTEFPEYPSVPFAGEMEDLDQIWGTAEVDIEASMDRVMNDINEGRVRLPTTDEWLSEQKKQKQVEPGARPNASEPPPRSGTSPQA